MGRGPCASCSHYRVAKPASELLGSAIGSNDAAVLSAIGKIQEDEKELAAQEAMERKLIEQSGQSVWKGNRPFMSDYCGLEEGINKLYVAQIRNSGLLNHQVSSKAIELFDLGDHSKAANGDHLKSGQRND